MTERIETIPLQLDNMLEAIDAPAKLETLYRSGPREFCRLFPELRATQPESLILQVWEERLRFEAEALTSREVPDWRWKEVLLVTVLSLVAGALARLPITMEWKDGDFYYQRIVPAVVFLPLVLYFVATRGWGATKGGGLLVLFLFGPSYLAFLRHGKSESESIEIACLYSPAIYLVLVGIAFAGGRWKERTARLDFLRFLGEMLVYSGLVLLGGVVLTLVTLGLFRMLKHDIGEWFVERLVVYGMVASPIVGAFLVTRFARARLAIAPLLARIFAPLFLTAAVVCLGGMVRSGASPYHDRDALIMINGLMVPVLGIAVTAILGRPHGKVVGFSDFINLLLLATTLAIDLLALTAIVFRLASYGSSPNRVAVLGTNLVFLGCLLGLLYGSVGFLRRRRSQAALEDWIAAYLGVFSGWSAFVAFGFPLLFRMK